MINIKIGKIFVFTALITSITMISAFEDRQKDAVQEIRSIVGPFDFIRNVTTDAGDLVDGLRTIPGFIVKHPVTSGIVALNLLPDAVMPSSCKTVLKIGTVGCLASLILRREDILNDIRKVQDEHTARFDSVQKGICDIQNVQEGHSAEFTRLIRTTDENKAVLSRIELTQVEQGHQLRDLVTSVGEQQAVLKTVDDRTSDMQKTLDDQSIKLSQLNGDFIRMHDDITTLRSAVDENQKELIQRCDHLQTKNQEIYNENRKAAHHLAKALEHIQNTHTAVNEVNTNVKEMRGEVGTMLTLLNSFTSTLVSLKDFVMSPFCKTIMASTQMQHHMQHDFPARSSSGPHMLPEQHGLRQLIISCKDKEDILGEKDLGVNRLIQGPVCVAE